MKNNKRIRRTFSASFKAQVAIEALKEQESLQELAYRFKVHVNQISKWKQEFKSRASEVFEKPNNKREENEIDTNSLYSKIGELEVENDYLKKNLKKWGWL